MDGAKDLGLHYQTRIGANSQSPWSQWEDKILGHIFFYPKAARNADETAPSKSCQRNYYYQQMCSFFLLKPFAGY